MARADTLSRSIPRIELDHRVREARTHLIRLERLVIRRPTLSRSRLSVLTHLFGFRHAREKDPRRAVRKTRWRVLLWTSSIAIALVGGVAAACFGSVLWNCRPGRRMAPSGLKVHRA